MWSRNSDTGLIDKAQKMSRMSTKQNRFPTRKCSFVHIDTNDRPVRSFALSGDAGKEW